MSYRQIFDKIVQMAKKPETVYSENHNYYINAEGEVCNEESRYELIETVEEALEGSIEKWELVRKHLPRLKTFPIADTCSLCSYDSVTNRQSGYKSSVCELCPVFERTGLTACRDTPYHKASAVFEVKGPNHVDTRKAIGEEVQFLKSLRN